MIAFLIKCCEGWRCGAEVGGGGSVAFWLGGGLGLGVFWFEFL